VAATWHAVAALVDPVRRALYDYVRGQDHPVTREEAAAVREISRNLAAFHLDKLVAAGLLRARYETPADQRRGRGRTPKVYEPVADTVALTIPERRYELVGEILADAVAEEPTNVTAAAVRLAFHRGRQIGQRYAASADGTGTGGDDLAAVAALLAELGFDPGAEGPGLVLHNCPFHALAVRQPELVCGLNHAFVAGLLAGVGVDGVAARLSPRPGACCVALESPPHLG
jgi:predicted ArsR family transcriptional regulator